MRNGDAMIALDVKTLATVSNGTDKNGLPRTIVIARVGLRRFGANIAIERNQIEDSCCESPNLSAFLMRHVSGHRQRFEINFGSHHGRPKIQSHAAFEPRDGLSQDQEVAIARQSKRGPVAVCVLMNNVIANP